MEGQYLFFHSFLFQQSQKGIWRSLYTNSYLNNGLSSIEFLFGENHLEVP